jgi:L-lactate dehydrogenase complex protein LldF
MKPGVFGERAAVSVRDPVLRDAMDRATRRQDTGRKEQMAELPDAAALRNLAGRIRERALGRLDEHLAQLADNVERAGGQVHWAHDATQACDIALQIARQHDVGYIVKSKSMLTEEIRLTATLEQAGLDVVETDLGQYIVQLAGQRPSHIVGPAVHMTVAQVASLLVEKLGIEYTEDPTTLTRAARDVLREKFRRAQMGITGVNIAAADSGAVCVVTNEGNGRFTTSRPAVCVAFMGIEKVVPTMRDLAVLLKVLPRSATGQRSSVYVNLAAGPRAAGEQDGPGEFHLVMVDNGRSDILAGPYAEILKCIRCGACLNACPVYRKVGGHAYDSVYGGPIGKLLTPLMQTLEARGELPHASSLCGACRDACSVMIDLPELLIKMRGELAGAGQPGVLEKLAVKFWAWANRSKGRYSIMAGLAKRMINTGAGSGWTSRLPGPGAGWTRFRDFPAMADKPFHKQWTDDLVKGED